MTSDCDEDGGMTLGGQTVTAELDPAEAERCALHGAVCFPRLRGSNMPNSHILVRIAVASGALVLSVGLAACGGTSGTSSNTPPAAATASTSAQPARRFNDADVRFRQMMIPHHRQAIAMAELAGDRAQNADVKALAQQIKNEQSPEIQTMTGFLQAWGAPVPSGNEPMGGMSGIENG